MDEFYVAKTAHDRRVTELLQANNVAVEKRRAATALLREAVEELRSAAYEAADADNGGAYRAYSDLRYRIETFLSEIHQ